MSLYTIQISEANADLVMDVLCEVLEERARRYRQHGGDPMQCEEPISPDLRAHPACTECEWQNTLEAAIDIMMCSLGPAGWEPAECRTRRES